jgi:hypothetical protein
MKQSKNGTVKNETLKEKKQVNNGGKYKKDERMKEDEASQENETVKENEKESRR